jgi:hypothetical protein
MTYRQAERLLRKKMKNHFVPVGDGIVKCPIGTRFGANSRGFAFGIIIDGDGSTGFESGHAHILWALEES